MNQTATDNRQAKTTEPVMVAQIAQIRWKARWAGFDRLAAEYHASETYGFHEASGDVGGWCCDIIDDSWTSASGWGS